MVAAICQHNWPYIQTTTKQNQLEVTGLVTAKTRKKITTKYDTQETSLLEPGPAPHSPVTCLWEAVLGFKSCLSVTGVCQRPCWTLTIVYLSYLEFSVHKPKFLSCDSSWHISYDQSFRYIHEDDPEIYWGYGTVWKEN